MDEFMKSLTCAGTECFCWILVLLNIFAVFYLVFCSFWKVSRLVKLSGWVYSGALIGVTILILFFHTCIYTLLTTVFTGMMLMAILSIILPQQGEPREKAETTKATDPIGAYVISETFDGWFVFGLYDAKRKKLVDSTYAYNSVEAAKEAIVSCRENGRIAETEDRSGMWIQEKYIPKFEICKYDSVYGFSLRVFEEDLMIHSKMFSKIEACLCLLEKVKANIGTTDLYMSVEKTSGEGFKKWSFVEAELVEEQPVAEQEIIAEMPTIEQEPMEQELVAEVPEKPKKCIVSVIWPESTNPDRIYRYHAQDQNVVVGDIVTAPTLDSYNKKEIVRKARVVSVEFSHEGDAIELPKKAIVSVEKNVDEMGNI